MPNKQTSIIGAILFGLFLFALESYAEQKTIRLICKYSHTIDADGKMGRTSGEDLITVNFTDDGLAVIRKQGLGAEFIGTITDEEIYGKTAYKIQNHIYQQTLLINRYTGVFEITFKITGSSGGLIHYGNCRPVTEKKF